MSFESKVNEHKPWLSQIVADSDNKQQALDRAGRISDEIYNKYFNNQKPRTLLPSKSNGMENPLSN